MTCWCCGRTAEAADLVTLGNHPEVAVCVRCAHSLSKRASAIEDRSRTGPVPRFRDLLRWLRAEVVRRGWHHNRVVGRFLRWIGRFTP